MFLLSAIAFALSVGVVLFDVSATYKVLEPAIRIQPAVSSQSAVGSEPAAPVNDPAALTPVAAVNDTAAAVPIETRKKAAFHPPCDITLGHLDPTCPRFVRITPIATRGLGDRFVQMLVPFLVALDADAVPMPIPDDFVDTHGTHGSYAWAKDFLDLNRMLPFNDTDAIPAAFPGLESIKPAAEEDYDARLASVADKCNVIIEIDMNVSHPSVHSALVDFGGPLALLTQNICASPQQICGIECYVASKPNFQRLRSALACNFMHAKGRAGLPPLVFDQAEEEYVVAVHIRRGDISLNAHKAYFTKLKAQVDEVLEEFPTLHYYFITEGADLKEGQPPFAFLPKIFPSDDGRTKTTYMNHLDAQASLLHMMNADLLVTTGSSFPYVAATVSPKPVVFFGQPKEKTFAPGMLRPDFVLIDDDGSIASPSIAEATALVAVRYEEVHGRPFPYRRRRQRRRSLRALSDDK